MGSSAHILVVDDEQMVREVVARYLEREGFRVTAVGDGQAAIRALTSAPDLIVLDLMLPKVDGLEVLRRARAATNSAVVMLTARGATDDRIAGLDLGADDYVAKPFSPRELVARVHAVLRRRREASDAAEGNGNGAGAEPLTFGRLVIDPGAREAKLGADVLALAPREFDLLHYFATNPRRVFSREDLLDALWDLSFDGDSATVTVHIRRLREKIEADPSSPERIVTVRGAGYRFEP
ncbi:MAG TPA: response regulator transcription factor [Solirubrobacterales bacterium]|nr:response regulator transcription factor [Solirubrobacterales bacterium]